MDIEDFSNVSKQNNVATSNYTFVIRNNEYQIPMSYRGSVSVFSNLFFKPSLLEDMLKEINAVKKTLSDLSGTFETRTHADSIYIKKTAIEAKLPALLTNSMMESLTAQYATADMMKKKAADARAQAHKAADEMTDFTGAAMVGINQSQAANELPPDETNPDEKKDS